MGAFLLGRLHKVCGLLHRKAKGILKRYKRTFNQLKQMNSHDIILTTRSLFARRGYDGVSMRLLATEMHCTPSLLYYYFQNKDQILEAMFQTTNHELGEARAKLPAVPSATQMLSQQVKFQFDHAEEVVAVLKYYMHFRENFAQVEDGLLPAKAHLHIDEVLRRGMESGEFVVRELHKEARIITHTINGFVLEYFPVTLSDSQLKDLVGDITDFLLRALRPNPLRVASADPFDPP